MVTGAENCGYPATLGRGTGGYDGGGGGGKPEFANCLKKSVPSVVGGGGKGGKGGRI